MSQELSLIEYLLSQEQLDIWAASARRRAPRPAAEAYVAVAQAFRAAYGLKKAAMYGAESGRWVVVADALKDRFISSANRRLNLVRADFALVQKYASGGTFQCWDYHGPSAHDTAMDFVESICGACEIPSMFEAASIKSNPVFRWRTIHPQISRVPDMDDSFMFRSLLNECYGTTSLSGIPRSQRIALASRLDLGVAVRGAAEPKDDHEVRAIVLLRQHPNWSMRVIAKKVGCSASTLSRSKLFQAAVRASRGEPPGGWKDSGTGEMDAYEN